MRSISKSILFVLILLTSIIANAQEFGESGTEWYYDERFAFSADVDYIKFTSTKDSMINGINCKMIRKSGSIICLNRPAAEFIYSKNDTVFFFDPAIKDFQILYDFTAKKGESWTVINAGLPDDLYSVVITVDSIRYENILDAELKVLYVNMTRESQEYFYPKINSRIIERIGDTKYFFSWWEYSTLVCDANYTKGLRCFIDPDLGMYSTGLSESCEFAKVGIDEKSLTEIKTYPNPSTGTLIIDANNKSTYTYEIFSLDGRILLSGKFDTMVKINISTIIDNLLVLVIKEEKRIISIRKIVKINDS